MINIRPLAETASPCNRYHEVIWSHDYDLSHQLLIWERVDSGGGGIRDPLLQLLNLTFSAENEIHMEI